MKKKLIIFMPSIEGGGVEKNLFIVANYLTKKISKISLISASKKYKNRFSRSIVFISPKSNKWDLKSRRMKYMICLFLLLKEGWLYLGCVCLCFLTNPSLQLLWKR